LEHKTVAWFPENRVRFLCRVPRRCVLRKIPKYPSS